MKIKQTIILCCILISSGTLFAEESDMQKQYREKVLQYNQDIEAAKQNIGMREEMIKSAKADFKPKLSAGGNFNYTGNPMELTLDIPSMGSPMSFQGNDIKYGISATIMQPVYTGGQISESYAMAQKEKSLAVGQSDMIKSDISYQADIRYWNTVAKDEVADVAKSFKQSVQKLVEVVRDRVEVEYTDRNDLLMAEVKLNEADYQLLQADNDYEIARMTLNSFAGVDFEKELPTDTVIIAINKVEEISQEINTAVNNRPEMRIAQEKISIQQSALKLEDSQFKPRLYVGLDGNYSSPGYNFKPDIDPNYAVYAKISIPIFEWGKRRSTKQASTYRINMAKENMSKVKDNINLEIQSAYYSYSQAVNKVQLTSNSLLKASENEQLALDKYKEGNISIVEVLEAQMYHQQAQLNYIQSKANAQIYRSGFIRALGLYSFK